MDLRLSTKAHASHRRVPSDEAILRMAAQQKIRPLDPRELVPAGSAPLPDPEQPPAPGTNGAAGGDDGGSAGAGAQPLTPDAAVAKRQAEASAVFGERWAAHCHCVMKSKAHLKDLFRTAHSWQCAL